MAEFMKKWGVELKCTASESLWGNRTFEKVVVFRGTENEKVVGFLKEMMRKLEEGVKRKEYGLAWTTTARNSLEMLGVYSPNEKVFGNHVSTLGNVNVEDMIPPQLKTNIERRILRDIGNPRNRKK